jgi:PTS system mannose-specific IIA component
MIGILLVAHGRLAEEFLAVLEHVVGPQENIMSLGINPEDDPKICRQTLLDTAQRLNQGQGVIILTDMFGGTPSNLALSVMGEWPKIEVIAGMNLPMLIKLMGVRPKGTLETVLQQAQEAGRKYINVASQLLPTSPPS